MYLTENDTADLDSAEARGWINKNIKMRIILEKMNIHVLRYLQSLRKVDLSAECEGENMINEHE